MGKARIAMILPPSPPPLLSASLPSYLIGGEPLSVDIMLPRGELREQHRFAVKQSILFFDEG
eukprot:14324245-Alexandrium_andersonii.AAC.1